MVETQYEQKLSLEHSRVISAEIDEEVMSACCKFPRWPLTLSDGLAIMQEESGETAKAVVDFLFHGKPIADVRNELLQTAAMCVRLIHHIDCTYPREDT